MAGLSITKPIVRFFYSGANVSLDELSVEDLMAENEGFEDSAEYWIECMLDEGVFNDSDGLSPLCFYICPEDKRAQLAEDFAKWQQAHQDIEPEIGGV